MISGIWNWLNERWPVSNLIRLALEEEMPGGASYAYAFGSSVLIVFLLQVITGIWQVFYYVPTLDHAYLSLGYFQTEVPFGWFVHQMHYWGANAMIILVVCHLSQVFIWGAYKRPHELKWLTGVLLLILTMAMSLSGGALPWNKRSYWVIEIAASIAGTFPAGGDIVRRLMLGGDAIGQITLSRFFAFHAAILPGIILLMIAIHLIALRRVGSAGPFDEAERRTSGPFWPDQVYMDGMSSALVFFVMVTLCVFAPAPFSGMSDPLDSSYFPKPEWNFLFLYELLKFFPGRLELVATTVIPFTVILILVLLPFYDRNPERNPARRPFAMAGYFVIIAGYVLLTIAGAVSKTPESAGTPVAHSKQEESASATDPSPVSAEKGKEIYQTQGCAVCHRVNGAGGTIGPPLSDEGLKGRSRGFLITQIRNPKAHNPATVMPSYTALSDEEINRLADYLLSLRTRPAPPAPAHAHPVGLQFAAVEPAVQKAPGTAATIIGSADHGELLFSQVCVACHGQRGTGGIPNPGSRDGWVPPLNPIERDHYDPDPKVFAEKIDPYIQHGARPEGPDPSFYMLAFGDTNALSQPQIADIEAYVLSLNGVDRGRLNHPGVEPMMFFWIAAALFGLTGLVLGGIWSKKMQAEGGGKGK